MKALSSVLQKNKKTLSLTSTAGKRKGQGKESLPFRDLIFRFTKRFGEVAEETACGLWGRVVCERGRALRVCSHIFIPVLKSSIHCVAHTAQW